MIDSLEALVDSFRGAHNRVRCFLHILNLVARVILVQLGKSTGRDDLDGTFGETDEDERGEGEDEDASGSDSGEDEGGDDDGIGGGEGDEEGLDEEGDNDLEGSVTEEDIRELLGSLDDLREGMEPLRGLQSKVSTTHSSSRRSS